MIITPLDGEQLSKLMQDAVRQGLFEYSKDQSNNVKTDRWLSVEELRDYLPGKPAVTTLYRKVQRREIPFKRMSKRLVFLQSDVDQWLQGKHCKTQDEINATAEQYLLSTKKRK